MSNVANVLDDYAVTLGALAADAPVSYDQDIDALKNEVNNLQQLGASQVESLGNLATFIARSAISAYQQ